MRAALHRPSLIEIDLEAIRYNIQQVSCHLPSTVQKWAVVKANAYGHGAIKVAHAIQDIVTGYCVSNLDEALELRESGINSPILILGIVPSDAVPIAIKEYITLTVASQEWLLEVVKKNPDLSGLSCHIKLDTGMGRIGIRDIAEIQDVFRILKISGAQVCGAFTHFATADEKEDYQLRSQMATFEKMIGYLPERPSLLHCSNSAASIWHSDFKTDAVRLGNVIYGLNPSGDALELPYDLKPALSLTSELVHVKEVPEGTFIGYGATYKTEGTQIIGTIPIGYADGLTRNMQGIKVIVEDQMCEIVGRVSMDQITIRLPQSYPIGTKVTLIGISESHEVTVQDWANIRETINYEVVCLLSDRLPRVYK